MSQSGSSVSGMTRDELLLRGSDWTLACDSVILNRLKEFSENLGKRSQEITHDCDTLAQDVDTLGYQISNVTNQFLMLGNTLFVENCVQEFEECSVSNNEAPVQSAVVESKAEKEAALIERMKESIRIGVGIQRQRDEIKANGFEESYGSVDSRVSSSVNLAHLIGSSKFFSNRYCGLLDENRLRQPSKPESVMSGVSIYDSTSLTGQDSTLLSEPEVPMSPSPILSDGTSYEPIAPSEFSESIVSGNQPPQEPPEALSPHEAIKRSLEERLKRMNLNANVPREQATNFYSDQPQVPSPPSVGSNESSSFGDNISSNIIREQSVVQPRSPSPVEYRPPPVVDLSDSDEDDMFASAGDISAPSNRFDDFFKNQNIYQPVFPSVFQPPPFLSEPPPPDLKHDDPVEKLTENMEPMTQARNAGSSAAQSSPIRNITGADVAAAQSAVQTSLPQQPTTTTRVRVLPDLQGPSKLVTTRIPTETKTVGEPVPAISKPQMQDRNIVTAPIVSPIAAPKTVLATTSVPPVADKLPPPRKKVSIFDSSDSDEDLFANFGQKKAPKTDLFASSEPVTAKVPTTYNLLRPPPILDVSDDSDDDIFSSLQRKKPSFLDRDSPSPVVGRQQLDEHPESIFSASISEPDRGAPSLQNTVEPSKLNSVIDDQGKNNDRLDEEPQFSAAIPTAESSAAIPTAESSAEAEAPDVMMPDRSSGASTVSGSPVSAKQRNESIPSDSQFFRTETIVPPEPPVILGRASPSSSSGGSDIFESTSYVPPTASDVLPQDPIDEPINSSIASPTKDTIFEATSNSQREPEDLFREAAYSRQEPPPLVPDFKPDDGSEEVYRPLKVKSIFESSDSDDDDLFAGGSRRTKTTPTLSYTSPLPPREPPELPQTKTKLQNEQKRTRIGSSDSDEDIFKSLSKTSRVEMPAPVDVPSSVQVTKVEEMSYPINEGNLAQVSDLQDNLTMPKSSLISSKPKKPPATSIFESSDSDDDLFSPISKGKSAPSLKNFVQRSSAPAKSVEVSSTKSASLFGDSDGEEDSLFSATKKKAEKPAQVSAVEPSINSLDPRRPVAAQVESDEKPENFSARQQVKILRQGPESKERLFGAVAKNLESILSAKLSSPPASPKKPIAVSLTSPVSPTDSVSFEDNTSTDNLLRCVTKDRPKILHPRRPPSVVIRRQISRSSESSELPPDSKELGYFV